MGHKDIIPEDNFFCKSWAFVFAKGEGPPTGQAVYERRRLYLHTLHVMMLCCLGPIRYVCVWGGGGASSLLQGLQKAKKRLLPLAFQACVQVILLG